MEDLQILNGVFGRLNSERKGKYQTVLCGYDLRGHNDRDRPCNKKNKKIDLYNLMSLYWYKYEQIFTSNYNNLDEGYKKELLEFKKMSISGNLESEYRRVWTKPITTYASNYNYFDISLAPLKEHIF